MHSELRINDKIRAKTVRLIDDNGSQVGIMEIKKAQQIATEKGLDLVEVAQKANPPVCKIMDYGKYKYTQKKKEHQAKQKQHTVMVKELRLRVKTDEHDIGIKIRKAREFLEKKYKVLISVHFRGREAIHPEMGLEVLNKFCSELEDIGKVERKPHIEGMRASALIGPLQ